MKHRSISFGFLPRSLRAERGCVFAWLHSIPPRRTLKACNLNIQLFSFFSIIADVPIRKWSPAGPIVGNPTELKILYPGLRPQPDSEDTTFLEEAVRVEPDVGRLETQRALHDDCIAFPQTPRVMSKCLTTAGRVLIRFDGSTCVTYGHRED